MAALVSEAPGGPVRASRRNLMAHAGVLQFVADRLCVLPMRFGVVMPGAEAVETELLREHEGVLTAQLEAFEELVEVDLKILCAEDVLLRTILDERPDLAELNERLRDRPAEATYHERVRLGELVAQAVEEKRAATLQRVVARLEPLTIEMAASEPAHEHMLVNVAFLAERVRLGELDAAVAELAALAPSTRFKYVGPLPPYHFVDTPTGAERAAWA